MMHDRNLVTFGNGLSTRRRCRGGTFARPYGVILRSCQLLLGLALVQTPMSAQAAGHWLLERGVSSYGRGGANFVNPQDPIAIYSNPAALAGLRGFHFMADGNMVYDNRTFTRAPDDLNDTGELTQYDAVSNDWPTFPPSPGFWLAYNFDQLGLPGLTVGAAGWGPPRSDTRYPEDGPQRYSVLETHNLQIHYGLAVAYELPWHKIRLGFTGQLVNQVLKQRQTLNVGSILGAEPESRGFDVGIDIAAEDNWIPTGTLGITAQPLPFLAFGASFQLPWKVSADGRAAIQLGDSIKNLVAVQGDEINVQINMPWILRAGVQYLDPNEAFDIELAFVYEAWSRNDVTRLAPKNISFEYFGQTDELAPIEFRSDWRDAYSVRLGGSYNLLPELLLLRAGVFYERSAVPETVLAPSAFDLDKVGVGFGARVDLPFGLWVDMATGYSHWLQKTVTGGGVRFTDPLAEPPDDGRRWPIGNGTYKNYQIMITAALGVNVDI